MMIDLEKTYYESLKSYNRHLKYYGICDEKELIFVFKCIIDVYRQFCYYDRATKDDLSKIENALYYILNKSKIFKKIYY